MLSRSPNANTMTRPAKRDINHRWRAIADDHGDCTGLPRHHCHRAGTPSVDGDARKIDVHADTVISLKSMLKRRLCGTHGRVRFRHVHHNVNRFAGRVGIRDIDTSNTSPNSPIASSVSGSATKELSK